MSGVLGSARVRRSCWTWGFAIRVSPLDGSGHAPQALEERHQFWANCTGAVVELVAEPVGQHAPTAQAFELETGLGAAASAVIVAGDASAVNAELATVRGDAWCPVLEAGWVDASSSCLPVMLLPPVAWQSCRMGGEVMVIGFVSLSVLVILLALANLGTMREIVVLRSELASFAQLALLRQVRRGWSMANHPMR
ncbi:MAG: hypothetical protein ACRDRW_05415 [Pseudonocardiaceae bacterium]